jgi:hypothetical protein
MYRRLTTEQTYLGVLSARNPQRVADVAKVYR